MDSSQLKPLMMLVALLVFAGCASVPKSSVSVVEPNAELASVIGSAQQGALVQLPAGNSLGVDTVIVGRTYFAASGRECRRLLQADGAPMQRVACKSGDDAWRFARDLSVSTSSSVSTYAAASSLSSILTEPTSEPVLLTPTPVSEEHIEIPASFQDAPAKPVSASTQNELLPFEVKLNETLWSFAKRTTGNALNWKAIAHANGILNAKALASGTVLDVPATLVSRGD